MVLAVLIVISALWLLVIGGSVAKNQDKELTERATATVTWISTAPGLAASDLAARRPLVATDLSRGTDIVVLVLDADGATLTSTGLVDGQAPAIPAQVLARARSEGSAAATVPAGKLRLRVHVRPWRRDDLGLGGFAVAAQTISRVQADRVGVVVLLVLSGLGSVAAATVGIWLVAGRALRPLRQLTATADDIGRSGDLGRRLPPVPPRRRPDDVGRLTASFNTMMDRVQGALLAQQRFTADASHELRTPLTTVRASAGFLRTHPDAAEPDRVAALADLEAEAARMSRLVDDLLTLARADGGQGPRLEPVELGELAVQVCRQARTVHPGRTVYCAVPDAPVVVAGDEDALRRLLWILVDNAVAHTPPACGVWVWVGPGVLQVSDDGPGIPPELRERVFDRFFRADESRRAGGAGLGLSIAAGIVRAHGGRIGVTGNDRGGACFTVELPASPPS